MICTARYIKFRFVQAECASSTVPMLVESLEMLALQQGIKQSRMRTFLLSTFSGETDDLARLEIDTKKIDPLRKLKNLLCYD